jgi:hypothetical protein
MNIDPEKALNTLHKIGPAYAKAKGARVLLEESLKVVKAQQTAQAEGASIAAREMAALGSEAYKEAVKGYADAVEIEESLRRQLITAEAAIELWRSMNASNRRMDRAAA